MQVSTLRKARAKRTLAVDTDSQGLLFVVGCGFSLL